MEMSSCAVCILSIRMLRDKYTRKNNFCFSNWYWWLIFSFLQNEYFSSVTYAYFKIVTSDSVLFDVCSMITVAAVESNKWTLEAARYCKVERNVCRKCTLLDYTCYLSHILTLFAFVLFRYCSSAAQWTILEWFSNFMDFRMWHWFRHYPGYS